MRPRSSRYLPLSAPGRGVTVVHKQVQRQLRLFGVGDLGDEDGGKEPPDGRPRHQSWDEAMAGLGRLLKETGFEAYLARLNSPDRGDEC